MKVIADDREEGSGVVDYLRKMKVDVEIKRLPVGDYLISDNIVVERKTANDFINSIIDKRLFKQITYMKKYYESPIIIIEGDIDVVLQDRLIKKQQILGALASLALLKIPIVYTNDPEETAYVILSILRKALKKQKNTVKALPIKTKHIKIYKTVRDAQIGLLTAIPGIGPALAERILECFGCPRKFFMAHPYELRKVGLGSERIKKIIEILDTKYPGIDGYLAETRNIDKKNQSS